MAQKKIALDAMGGDHGPVVTVAAAKLALDEIAGIELVLVGDRGQLEAEFRKHGLQQNNRIGIHHASEVVGMDDLPVVALKKKKDSSMRVAIDLVKEGKVQACVSAGNTGALMATSKFVLKTIRGISRPAICTALPGINGRTHMLDLGANPDCTPENLAEFALMGSILAQSVDGIRNPRVGLLNIGSEEIKGSETIKRASQLIAESRLNYYGFVEGDDIYKGTVDVVVTDGFVGNVSLKTGEGLAALVNHVLQSEFKRNWLTKLSAICAMPVLSAVKRRLDPRRYNGASLLGLNGIVIKSHGSADTSSFLNAIKIADIEIENNVPQRISGEIENYFSQIEEAVT
ncbi:MAG: phosphate acyltransferase PlsX [Gammaproteobacteria bacterium]|nr:phosphate acyltransferase PlsX [Gammaproteobacteria bacterium]